MTNYDGSQDEGDTVNDDVLLGFFQPFMGKDEPAQDTQVHIIAINENIINYCACNTHSIFCTKI